MIPLQFQPISKQEFTPEAVFAGTNVPEMKQEHELRVANEIAERRSAGKTVVVFGAPASGKSEQMDLVLPENREVFDLSLRFVEAYSKQSGRPKEELKPAYNQPELKKIQRAWLEENRKQLARDLIASPSEIVIFDEFDFSNETNLSIDEEQAAVQIIRLAHEVRQAGKEVLFIIHSAAFRSKLFWKGMHDYFAFSQNELIYTQFFSDQEEEYLLNISGLNERDKRAFRAFAQGSPTAYLPILKHKADNTLESLQKEAIRVTSVVIRVTKQCIPLAVREILLKAAKNEMDLTQCTDRDLVRELLASSFVGQKNGTLFMPAFAADCLLKNEREFLSH